MLLCVVRYFEFYVKTNVVISLDVVKYEFYTLSLLNLKSYFKHRTNFDNKLGCTFLKARTSLNIFLLNVNFDKSINGLHLLFTSLMLTKFIEN